MKNWIINENELTNKYLIVTEKSIWISEQLKELDINELNKVPTSIKVLQLLRILIHILLYPYLFSYFTLGNIY